MIKLGDSTSAALARRHLNFGLLGGGHAVGRQTVGVPSQVYAAGVGSLNCLPSSLTRSATVLGACVSAMIVHLPPAVGHTPRDSTTSSSFNFGTGGRMGAESVRTIRVVDAQTGLKKPSERPVHLRIHGCRSRCRILTYWTSARSSLHPRSAAPRAPFSVVLTAGKR